jgi:hypothetical protein
MGNHVRLHSGFASCDLADTLAIVSARGPIRFCRETHEKPYLKNSEGEALGVRKHACAFHIVNIINALKAAASLPHSKAPFGRELSMMPY